VGLAVDTMKRVDHPASFVPVDVESQPGAFDEPSRRMILSYPMELGAESLNLSLTQ
jgi:hypothetical protein